MASRHSESSRVFSSRSGNNTRDRTPDDFWDCDLPISRKGRFFDDSFFESSRFDFDKKVNEILGRWGDEGRRDRWDDDEDFRPSSNFNRYRNLRAQDLKDENQAMTVTSDDTAHKVGRGITMKNKSNGGSWIIRGDGTEVGSRKIITPVERVGARCET